MNLSASIQKIATTFRNSPFLWLIVAMWIGSAAWAGWKRYQNAESEKRARSWPTGDARVMSVDISRVEGKSGNGMRWKAVLTYSYRAQEIEVGDYTRRFALEVQADEWWRALQSQTITVNINPTNPRESAWLESDKKQAQAAAIAGQAKPVLKELSRTQETLRVVAFVGALVGASFAFWAQVMSFTGGKFLQPESNEVGFFSMHIGAMATAALSGYISKARFSESSIPNAFEKLGDPSVRWLVKLLGAYGVSVFLLFWVRVFFDFETDCPRAGVRCFLLYG